ncbi:MAG: protein translocase subunit SecD [Acutalibacteraceae bacterium]|nr:protein translocase subunit SecD [Acutalibacteraceae bacterium]
MKIKRARKSTFFIVLALILLLTYTAFFGIESWHGDTRNVYVKGAKDIRWGIDIRGGVEAVFTPDIAESEITDDDMDAAKTIIDTRMVSQNITDYEIYADKENHQIVVRFPWESDDTSMDPAAAVASLGETAELTFCKGSTYSADTVIFKGDHVTKATPAYDETNGYIVALELDSTASELFSSATKELASSNGQIAISMDGNVITAPTVNEQITGGSAIITGMADAQEAEDLADKINAGSLPFALSVDDSKLSIVSPSLGENALRVMVIAGSIAFGVICILMIIRYRANGVVAAIALLGQLAGSIAAISGFFPGINSFTLTIPGIAGIILSIGVGVDCNVIAAERIKQEFKNGKTIDGSIDSGLQNSLSAIIDGNVTILIVAFVLMGAFGTKGFIIYKLFSLIFGASIAGSIYSFGYTLLIGVIFNLLMGVVCSKLMLRSVSQFKCLRKPWLYGGKNND